MNEDAAWHVFKGASPGQTRPWLKRHLRQTYASLLEHGWVRDLDSMVNPPLLEPGESGDGLRQTKPVRYSFVTYTFLLAHL